MFLFNTIFLILDSLIRYARSSTWDGGCGLNLDLKMERRASSWHPGLSLNRVIYHNDLLKFIHWGCKAMSSTFNFNSVAEMVAMNAQPIIQSIPQSSKEFYLSPWSFDFSEKSKYGENGRFPTNLQYKAHFQSFLRSGYEASREPIDVRFREGGDGTIEPFSVQFVDGQNKMLIIQSILALVELCDAWIESRDQFQGGLDLIWIMPVNEMWDMRYGLWTMPYLIIPHSSLALWGSPVWIKRLGADPAKMANHI